MRVLAAISISLLVALAYAQGDTEPAPEPNPSFQSPRATMRTFLEAMDAGEIGAAASTLDLSSISAIRREGQGEQAAFRLWAILNRTRQIDLEDIPDRRDGAPFVFFEYGDAGAIVIERSGTDWRFSTETVAQLPAIWEAVRDEPVLEGMRDVDRRAFDPDGWLRERVPWPLRVSALGLQAWQWIGLALLPLVAWFAGSLIRLVARAFVSTRVKFASGWLTQKTLVRFGYGVSLFVAVWIVRWGLPFLGLPGIIERAFLVAIKLLTAFAIVMLGFAAWDIAIAIFAPRATRLTPRAEQVMLPLMSSAGKVVIVCIALVYFVMSLGFDVVGIVAGLGIGGLVLALAAKDSVENVFGSVTVLLEMPYGVGDWIKIADIEGVVEEITVTSTRVRTFEDSMITMPNSLLINTHVENYGLRRFRRIDLTLGLTYDTPRDALRAFVEAVRQYLLEYEHINKEQVHVYFHNYGESTLDVMVYTYVFADKWRHELQYREEILLEIYRIADELGVEFAFPTRTLVFDPEGMPELPTDDRHT